MVDEIIGQLPPLQGCLYCHSEGTTTLTSSRKFLGFGSDYSLLKCSHCNSVALFDYNAFNPDNWRIRYRRVNHAPRYYYVTLHLGRAGWLSAQRALALSTNGYVQRMRVAQAKSGDLAWLQPASPNPPPPLMSAEEQIFLTLKAVTLRETPPPGLLVRADHGAVLDSGKFYVTDEKLYLLGQRRDWSHALDDIKRVEYDDKSWTIYLDKSERPEHYRGVNASDQLDAQLVSAVVETLWRVNSV